MYLKNAFSSLVVTLVGKNIDCKKGDNLLQRETIYSGVEYPWGSPTSGERLLRDRFNAQLLRSRTNDRCSQC